MKTWVTSDLHLGHYNIMKYCNRPFDSLNSMNQALIWNWNRSISKYDTVYFLGDLAFTKHIKLVDWLKMLNGQIIFIQGNHDPSRQIQFDKPGVIKYKGRSFYIVHDPKDVPARWSEWVIHGHQHNNNLVKYPFINFENKTVNASVDVTQYRPVDMDYIVGRIYRNY
ncbi:metallophosphoesterase family protein [Methanosarcina sp. UBA5]|uniref:metallophosphoesterase family protein n=1 Tax=Methanosarcina sp. UBA5 TaxID=1915593 RepID=UPI0025F88016|nr:metallophosphoesterase family protein [Methanosarcina sp. UBA5]